MLAVVLAFVVVSHDAGAQCRGADDSSFDMIELVKSYALVGSDSAYNTARIALGIPAVGSSSRIARVTKAPTCKSANAAYQAAATGARQTLSGKVHVVQVGASYVVWDPAYRFNPAAPADIYMVFNAQWVRQSTF